MNSDWPEMAFAEVIDFREGPGIMAYDFRNEGVPLVRVAGLSGPSVLQGCNYLDREMVEAKWSHFRVMAGDTLLSTSASLGRVAVVAEEAEGAIPYTGIIRMRAADTRVLPSFVPYLLRGPHFQRQAEAVGSGSVLRHFGPSHLRTMTVVVPPVDEQRRIAWVLGSLDDKIENNRRIVNTLEQTVSTLFKARFVDFMDQAHLVESEIGPIPNGWSVKEIADLADINARTIKRGQEPSVIRYVDISSLEPRTFGGARTLAFGDAPSRARRIVRDGDTLVSTVRPERRAMAFVPRAGSDLVASTGFAVVSPRPDVGLAFVYRCVTRDECIDHLAASASGSAYPAVNPHLLATWRVAVPPDQGREFDAAVLPLELLRHELLEQFRTLAGLRDRLLPRLISGDLRVPPAEGVAVGTG